MRNVRLMFGAALVAGLAGVAVGNTNEYTSEAGVLVLNPTAANAAIISGSGLMRVPRILVNSTSAQSISVSGNGTLRSRYIHTAGEVAFQDGAEVTGLLLQTAGDVQNPFGAMAMPTSDDVEAMPDLGGLDLKSGHTVISPGYYSGGISVSSNARVTMLPGEYYVGGLGFAATSGVVSGNGVTLIVMDGMLDFGGSAEVDIQPPSGGAYAGISVLQPPSNSSMIELRGNSAFYVGGTVVAPAAHIDVRGNGGVFGNEPFFGDLLVCDTVDIGGNGAIKIGEWLVAGNLPTANLYD